MAGVDLAEAAEEQLDEDSITAFNTVLSFSRESITIQQLYQFSVKFARFLKDNAAIKDIMKQYHDEKESQKRPDQQNQCSLSDVTSSMAWLHGSKLLNKDDHKMTKEDKFTRFKTEYFPAVPSKFDMAVAWLYDTAETNADLCNNINIFWSVRSSSVNNMILKIYDFMQNAQHVDGSYILNPEQFSLWKLDLKITEDAMKKLFNIVRGYTP
eukprot:644489_1